MNIKYSHASKAVAHMADGSGIKSKHDEPGEARERPGCAAHIDQSILQDGLPRQPRHVDRPWSRTSKALECGQVIDSSGKLYLASCHSRGVKCVVADVSVSRVRERKLVLRQTGRDHHACL